jgi:hypothetical protein
MPLVSRGPTASHGSPFCRFHRDICASIHQLVQDIDAGIRGIPHRDEDLPGQTAAQLRNGVSRSCYICISFWSRAPEFYRNGVETNNLDPPHNLDGVVNSYGYDVMGRNDRGISMSVYYHSGPIPRLSSGRKINAGGKKEYVQIFRILPAGGMHIYADRTFPIADFVCCFTYRCLCA